MPVIVHNICLENKCKPLTICIMFGSVSAQFHINIIPTGGGNGSILTVLHTKTDHQKYEDQ